MSFDLQILFASDLEGGDTSLSNVPLISLRLLTRLIMERFPRLFFLQVTMSSLAPSLMLGMTVPRFETAAF